MPLAVRLRHLYLTALVLLIASSSARLARAEAPDAGPPDEPSPTVTKWTTTLEATLGTTVSIHGEAFPNDVKKVSLSLGDHAIAGPAQVATRTLVVVIPKDEVIGSLSLLHGEFTLDPATHGGAERVPFDVGYVHVLSDVQPALTLKNVSPRIVTPDRARIAITGEGFGASLASAPELLLDSEVVRLRAPALKCEQPAPGKPKPPKGDSNAAEACRDPVLSRVSPYELQLELPAASFEDEHSAWLGAHQLSLRRGDVATEAILVNVTPHTAGEIRLYALIASAVVLLSLCAIAFGWGGRHTVRPSRRHGAREVYALLIDPQTDTYSLNKLQFYAWSAVALVAYAYLAVSRALAQGHLDIVDVPANLPGILAISGATTVASIGITRAKGSKAAGDVHPSLSDLISTGGIIAPERFQFLLWTFVAIGAFALSVARTDPTLIDDLPAIPTRLLLLSGVSSAGYLGGKLMRAPGPVIDDIVAKVGSIVIEVLGHNFLSSAVVEIENVSVANFLDVTAHPEHRPELVESSGSTAATTLQLKLASAPHEWLKEKLMVTVTNPDGQKASWPLTLESDVLDALRKLESPTPGGPVDGESAVLPIAIQPVQAKPANPTPSKDPSEKADGG